MEIEQANEITGSLTEETQEMGDRKETGVPKTTFT